MLKKRKSEKTRRTIEETMKETEKIKKPEQTKNRKIESSSNGPAQPAKARERERIAPA